MGIHEYITQNSQQKKQKHPRAIHANSYTCIAYSNSVWWWYCDYAGVDMSRPTGRNELKTNY